VNQCERASVRSAAGDIQGALTMCESALDTISKLVDEFPGNVRYQLNLAAVFCKIGDVLIIQGKADSAARRYREAIGITEQLVFKDPEDVSAQKGLYHSLDKLALALHRDEPGESVEISRRAVRLVEHVAARDAGNTEWQEDLASLEFNFGTLLKLIGDHVGAETHRRKAQQVADDLLARDPSNRNWQNMSAFMRKSSAQDS